MRPTLSVIGAPLGVPIRWLLFGTAVIAGAVAGDILQTDPLDRAYNGLLMLFGEPGIQIASLATGAGLGLACCSVRRAACWPERWAADGQCRKSCRRHSSWLVC